jgi:hypothetical protein
MQKGLNHNIRYGNRIFHLQTEDFGERNMVIVTHLFYGGDILASRRKDYRMAAGMPVSGRQVRLMMNEQHKAMIKELVGGSMDDLIPAHDRTLEKTHPGAASVFAHGVADPDAVTTRPVKRSTLEEYMGSERSLDELVIRSLLEMERGAL